MRKEGDRPPLRLSRPMSLLLAASGKEFRESARRALSCIAQLNVAYP